MNEQAKTDYQAHRRLAESVLARRHATSDELDLARAVIELSDDLFVLSIAHIAGLQTQKEAA